MNLKVWESFPLGSIFLAISILFLNFLEISILSCISYRTEDEASLLDCSYSQYMKIEGFFKICLNLCQVWITSATSSYKRWKRKHFICASVCCFPIRVLVHADVSPRCLSFPSTTLGTCWPHLWRAWIARLCSGVSFRTRLHSCWPKD